MASFAPEGPTRCSGLEVMRYSPEAMHAEFGTGFRLLDSRQDHHAPGGVVQAFVYCLWRLEPPQARQLKEKARGCVSAPCSVVTLRRESLHVPLRQRTRPLQIVK